MVQLQEVTVVNRLFMQKQTGKQVKIEYTRIRKAQKKAIVRIKISGIPEVKNFILME